MLKISFSYYMVHGVLIRERRNSPCSLSSTPSLAP